MFEGKILLAHGSGGKLSHDLVSEIYVPRFSNPFLEPLDDSARITKQEKQSGRWRPRQARLSTIGNARLRRALWMPTLAAVRCNPWLAAHYQRLREKGKPPKVALIAAMRKLLTAVYSVAKNRKPFTHPAPSKT